MAPTSIHVNSHHRRKFYLLSACILVVVYVTFRMLFNMTDISAATYKRARVLLDEDLRRMMPTPSVVDPQLNEIQGRVAANKIVKEKQIYTLEKEWFLRKCFDVGDINSMSFDFFDEYLEKLSKSSVEECRLVVIL